MHVNAQSLKAVFRSIRNFNYLTLPIFWGRLKLLTYKDAITEIVPGNLPENGGVFAIFVIFPANGLIDASIFRAINALNGQNANVLVVSNASLSAKAISDLRERTWRIIRRRNTGFDFGGYKDGVKFLTAERRNADRVILLNDSVFYSSSGLDNYFSGLVQNYDAVAAFENWGEGHHLQSYGLSLSGDVFRSASFQNYWKSYVPIGHRVYAIEKGEKNLSDAILQAAKTSRVLYNVSYLMERVRNNEVWSRTSEFENSEIEAPAFRDKADGAFESGKYEPLQDFVVPIQWRRLLERNDRTDPQPRTEIIPSDNFRSLIDIVNVTSPIHSGAFLFPYFMGCPIYKKDLVYRQRFQFWELSLLFRKTMPPREYVEYMQMLRVKGDYKRLSKKDFRLYSLGIK